MRTGAAFTRGLFLAPSASEPSPNRISGRAADLSLLGTDPVVIYENGAADVLSYEDVADPQCPEGCVLIDVEAISIEGGDLLARAGSAPPSVPHIVGYLAAGTVLAVGGRVEDAAAGDRVVTL